MEIRMLDFVGVPSRDGKRTREFYVETLGFLRETLDTGVCHMAAFRDPEGNDLMLHRRYAPHRPGSA